ncbi:MAG: hypothetical protein KA230_06185 [Flavobacteriales bacterium]|nr:hypothetical protein [Flavobacteriales bacterium]
MLPFYLDGLSAFTRRLPDVADVHVVSSVAGLVDMSYRVRSIALIEKYSGSKPSISFLRDGVFLVGTYAAFIADRKAINECFKLIWTETDLHHIVEFQHLQFLYGPGYDPKRSYEDVEPVVLMTQPHHRREVDANVRMAENGTPYFLERRKLLKAHHSEAAKVRGFIWNTDNKEQKMLKAKEAIAWNQLPGNGQSIGRIRASLVHMYKDVYREREYEVLQRIALNVLKHRFD